MRARRSAALDGARSWWSTPTSVRPVSRGERSRVPHVPLARAGARPEEEFDVPQGDEQVQDALMEQLRLQVTSQTLKEEIKEGMEGKKEEIKELGEKLQRELDEELKIEKFRTELQTSEQLEEAMGKFDALEEEIRALRDQAQADREDLAAWEVESAAARSKGLFFRSLYTPDKEAGPGGDGNGGAAGRGGAAPDPKAAARLAAARAQVTASAEEEVRSPLRLYLFTYMAVVLVGVAAQDVLSSAPGAASLPQDGLYVALAALLGVNAWNERGALQEQLARRQISSSSSQQPGGTEGAASGEQRAAAGEQQPEAGGGGGADST